MSEIQALMEIQGIGSKCANCGFQYWAHEGHIIPCPLCELAASEENLRQAKEGLEKERIKQITYEEIIKEFIGAVQGDQSQEYKRLASKFNLDCQAAQSRAYKAEQRLAEAEKDAWTPCDAPPAGWPMTCETVDGVLIPVYVLRNGQWYTMKLPAIPGHSPLEKK